MLLSLVVLPVTQGSPWMSWPAEQNGLACCCLAHIQGVAYPCCKYSVVVLVNGSLGQKGGNDPSSLEKSNLNQLLCIHQDALYKGEINFICIYVQCYMRTLPKGLLLWHRNMTSSSPTFKSLLLSFLSLEES